MKLTNLEAALQARPFRPFELRIDGEVIVIRHPEQIFFAENKTTLVIDVGERIHILDISHVAKLALLRRKADSSGATP